MVSKTSDYDDDSAIYGRICGYAEKTAQHNEAEKKYLFRSTLDRYRIKKAEGEMNTVVNRDSLHPGDVKMDQINMWLGKAYRSTHQKEFHQAFLSTCLRLIYKKDYEKERHRIMAKYGFKSKKQQALVCAPRRVGKTFAVAFFVVVAAICINDSDIAIFSPGKRQSVSMAGHIFSFMKKLGVDDMVIQKNEEKMRIRTLGGGTSKISAYPSAVKTLKGVSGTIIILEELAVLDPAVLFEVVLPLHQLDAVALIGISTVTTSDSFFTKYLTLEDANGETIFSVKHIYLACQMCRDSGVAASCQHNSFLLPNWSSARKRRVINRLMEGQESLLAREIGGVANELHGRAFLPKMLNAAKARERYHVDHIPDYDVIFIAIDPNAGGESEFAIMSMLRHHGLFIIIGMETFKTKSARENHAMVLAHCKELDGTQLYQNTRKVFIIESNLGRESEHLAATIGDNVRNHLVMNPSKDRTGFLTTNASKAMSVEKIRTMLADRSFTIADKETMVCISYSYEKIVDLLFEQMTNFSEVVKEHDNKAPTKYYSGKVYAPDDLCMVLLFLSGWSDLFYADPRYSGYF